jgi:hypothetical protein
VQFKNERATVYIAVTTCHCCGQIIS